MIGKTIQNFEFISEIGKGGMGVVYKAYDKTLDRNVAIKVLDQKVCENERFINRFKSEAKHHAKFSHPNIITLFGFLEEKNFLGIIMELVEGDGLDKLIYEQRRLHVGDTIYIMKQIVSAVAYAHSKGIIHRDIKPSNIILGFDGSIKIMDFGISMLLLEGGVAIQNLARVGTVFYMSPEQITGGNITHKTDIYSIGITFYEMLVGEPPFYFNNDEEIIEGHLKMTPSKVTSLRPGVPEIVDFIIDKCLTKSINERYNDCNELFADVDRLDQYVASIVKNYSVKKDAKLKRDSKLSFVKIGLFLIALSLLILFSYNQVNSLLRSSQLSKLTNSDTKKLFNIPTTESTIGIVFPIPNNLVFVEKTQENHILIIDDLGNLYSKNLADTNWNIQINNDRIKINDAIKVKENVFFACENSVLLKFEDSTSVKQQIPISTHTSLLKIFFISDNLGYLIGDKGTILQTKNSGSSWEALGSGTGKLLYDIGFCDKKKGFIVGWDGTLLKTEDSGYTWERVESFTQKYLKRIVFLNSELGMALGGGGSMFLTSDGGNSWEQINLENSFFLNDVKFLDEKRIIAVGDRGVVIVSSDGGEMWQKVNTRSAQKLNKCAVVGKNEVLIIGNYGTVIKYNFKGVD